jgi:hypothetical protein
LPNGLVVTHPDENTIVFTVIENLSGTFAPTVAFSAMNHGVVSENVTITIGSLDFVKIPITSDYFQFTTTGGTINDTVVNFSAEVIGNPGMLSGFNSIDFSGTDVKYVADNARFDTNVFIN